MRIKYKKRSLKSVFSRRKFLINSLIISTAGIALVSDVRWLRALCGQQTVKTYDFVDPDISNADGESLYNGICLPAQWPPRDMKPYSWNPMPVPYLTYPPDVTPIDVRRQLFVDDFLIEYSNLKRRFHQPAKYEGKPVLSPGTEVEMN
jgi:hypothetical protein